MEGKQIFLQLNNYSKMNKATTFNSIDVFECQRFTFVTEHGFHREKIVNQGRPEPFKWPSKTKRFYLGWFEPRYGVFFKFL